LEGSLPLAKLPTSQTHLRIFNSGWFDLPSPEGRSGLHHHLSSRSDEAGHGFFTQYFKEGMGMTLENMAVVGLLALGVIYVLTTSPILKKRWLG